MSSTSAALVAFSVSLLLSLTLYFYQRALIPIYGSVPTHLLSEEIVLAAIVLATTLKWFSRIKFGPWLVGAAIFLISPKSIYWVSVWTARWRDPIVGPTVTHLLTLLPLVLTYTLAGLTYTSGAADSVACAGVIYLSTWMTKTTWERISYLNSISESQIFFALSALWLFIYIYTLPSTSSAVIHDKKSSNRRKTNPSPSGNLQHATPKFILVATYLAGLYVTYPVLKSPVLPHPLKATYTHPIYPIEIHSSVQSTTGLIVVGQALPPSRGTSPESEMYSVRYLRAAHSILGGVWTDERVHVLDNIPPLVDSHGTRLGDSIYGVFVLQEAARMVNNTGKSHPENALVIGLGAGISTTSLMRHGIKTSIVEIDPAVYDAARTWFGLPDPAALGGQVYLEDAREWMRKAVGRNITDPYDIVIHDCFSGGGVPEHLYTVEFWNDLKTVLHPEGVLVVNFVGRVDSPSSRMVLHTLEKTIGRCRAFHDLLKTLEPEKYKTEFLNILFFCSTSSKPPTFRDPRPSDWLGSPLRRHALGNLHETEIDLDLIRGADADQYLLTDATNSLNKLQEEQGGFHWKLMRKVLDDKFWEVY